MFEDDEKFGQKGEDKCFLELMASPLSTTVIDVRKDKYFQEKDIDFLQVRGEEVVKIEVKTDRHSHITGNLFYETKSKTTVGCLARSEADIVYYYEYETDTVYYVNLKWLRTYLEMNPHEEKSNYDGAKGYLINLAELEKERIARRKKNGQ